MTEINSEALAFQIANNLLEKFKSQNYIVSKLNKGNHNYNFQIKGSSSSVNILVYFGEKGYKIVVQGNRLTKLYQDIYNKIHTPLFEAQQEYQDSNKINEPEFYIGVDESGKGDFFGPLVIAGFYVTPAIKKELNALQVQDSKELTEHRTKEIATLIKNRFKEYFTIVKIYPPKYNELYSKVKNLNKLLAWGHSRCIENILSKQKVPIAICDQFGDENYIKNALMKKGKEIELIQTTKAERFIGVAAASILARDAFIEWMDKTEKKLGLKLPKGAGTTVKITAKQIIENFGKDTLQEYVKVHFKTMNEL